MQWRVGKPNVRIRKASLVCLIKIIEQDLIEKEKLYECDKNIMTNLKNCLDDDWANDIRFAAVVFTRHYLPYLKDHLTNEDYNVLYPELLKRLDDAQDSIRIEVCKVFEIFFDQIPNPWSSSLYEYTIKTIFIHLDDQNEKIQQAIVSVLRKASRVQRPDFIQQCREFEKKSVHPALVKSLMDFATTQE